MADYYQDLLGGAMEAAPEQPSVPESEPALPKRSAAGPCQNDADSSPEPYSGRRSAQSSQPSTRTLAPTRLPALETQSALKPPPPSPIIPAAFPKLAPATKSEEKPQVKEATAVKKVEVKTEPPELKPAATAPAKEPAEPKTKVVEEISQPDVSRANEADTPQDTSHIVAEPRAWLDNGRPDWGQDRFECLLFSVAGLKLAVPLISLGSIHKLDKDLTPLVGRASWFMGLYRSGDRNIRVVDTARWVMPDRYNENVPEGYEFIIRLGDSDWGMACDAVEQAIQLEPSQVKWRTERSKRPWLSGTVIEHMCALLDADTLGWLLDKDARKH